MSYRMPNRLRLLSRWPVLAVLCWSFLLAVAAAADSKAEVVSESQIKAAFLYNFTKFVEWPPDSFPSRGQPIVIAVLGGGTLAAELEAVVTGRKVNGHPILVRSVQALEGVLPAQMLFVGVDKEAGLASLPPSLQASSVLTVGESETFAASGGAIFFVRQDGKLRFEINMTPAERARLKISAELQKLALDVHRTQ
jgi:hypothetical protein